MDEEYKQYFVPAKSYWPLTGSIALISLVTGIVGLIHERSHGPYLFIIGSLLLAYMMYGWFSNIINESQQGLYSKQMDHSFRLGMVWFIFSEIMFFAAFFGALFYARKLAVPWLGGHGAKASTHLLWSQFTSVWPLLISPDPIHFPAIKEAMGPWGLPAINTLILLSSGLSITYAHHSLLNNKRRALNLGLAITILLGISFIGLQALEYHHAYHELNLKLSSGIYGTTFFMLTGFHGAHVTIGTIMLLVIFIRSLKGHFNPQNHFGFQATAWYWHFVDVVWLILFVFVYWL
ncbi:MAG: cytochrome c oxidase, subunit [Francisellaceae bacterium]|nr:cytochrome c oxidase, subunit [Francisellaceae bacterium]